MSVETTTAEQPSIRYRSYEITKINGDGSVLARIIREGVAQEVKILCKKFKECKGPTYNPGFVIHLCSKFPYSDCATANTKINRPYDEEEFKDIKPGTRLRYYIKQRPSATRNPQEDICF